MDMETPEALQQRVRREQQMIARLRLAMTRLADAERERVWAMVAAKEAGLSIRQIARATGVSPTRVHQLLQGNEAREIPVWLSQLHDPHPAHSADPEADPPAPPPLRQTPLTDEAEVLRWCIAWLERLEHEDHVVVNLRPASEEETEFVPFDRPRVLRVLARIAADLDELARRFLENAEELVDGQEEHRARHRQRLAEPEPPPRRLSRWEERAASRQALGLPPYERS
jgi:transcriptional regulator with XRE-family HTH domain